MNKSHIERALDDCLFRSIERLGFEREESLFYRKSDGEVTLTIGFPCRLEKNGILVSYIAGIRYYKIKELVAPDSASFDDTIFAGGVVVAPHHSIENAAVFYEWCVDIDGSVAVVADKIMKHVEKYAINFWRNYKSLEKLSESLDGRTRNSCIVLNPEQRICLRACLYKLNGNSQAAIQLLEKGLAERAAALPKKRRPLERLLLIFESKPHEPTTTL